jgi:O-antigen ligase
VHARFDYWEAGIKIAAAKPFLGSGPGAFGVSYKAIKRPESEMARLAHNDYLEQATDSGVLGFATYLLWVAGIIWFGRHKPKSAEGILRFTVWLGFLAWALQGLMEFGFYIPALAWTGFACGGWIVSRSESGMSNVRRAP